MTLLVVPITVETARQALAQAQLAKAGGADAVEYRVDRLAGAIADVCALVAASPLLCIVTCRHACETGGFDGPEAVRVALYAALAASPKPPMALDVEWVKWQAEPKWAAALAPLLAAGRTKLILSSHDFNGRPEDLDKRLEQMLKEPLCDVPKLAWKAQGLEDCALAMRLLAASPRPAVVLAMGEAGMPSRILAKKAGAFMTFAALDKTSGTAPGQPLLSEMKNLYRWDDIKTTTKVYGVIGCPVGHSMSPAIHNAGFKAIGFDGVYVPMRIEAGYENLSLALDAWMGCKGMDFGGASVTIPHKENLLRFCAERKHIVSSEAKMIGAANTLILNREYEVLAADGKIIRKLDPVMAANTDRAGILYSFVEGLDRKDPDQYNLFDKWRHSELRVAIIGAGGAARAAVVSFFSDVDDLCALGAITGNRQRVCIFNRSVGRAEMLANEFGVQAMPWSSLSSSEFDLIINCTPLGMHPNVDASPLSDGHPALKPGVVVFDTVYNPVETKLLRQAKAAGCICIPGTEMFVRQAAAQFKAWTGKDVQLDVFRRVLAEKLG